MSADNRSARRGKVLESLKSSRVIFARAGNFYRASRIELGIQLLLDQRVSDNLLNLLIESAAVAGRDAADLVRPVVEAGRARG